MLKVFSLNGTENFGTTEDYRRKVLDIYIEDFSCFKVIQNVLS